MNTIALLLLLIGVFNFACVVHSQSPPSFKYTVDVATGSNSTTCGANSDACIDIASALRSFNLALANNNTDRTQAWLEVVMLAGIYIGSGNLENDLFGYASISIISDGNVTIDSQGLGRPFKLVEPTALTTPYSNTTVTQVYFYGATFVNGLVSNMTDTYINGADRQIGGGGAFLMYVNYTRANVVFDTCTFQNNKAQSAPAGYGGAIRTASDLPHQGPSNAALTLKHSIFSDNHATQHGGAIYADSATTTINNCTFTTNVATGSGGALFITGDTATVSASTFIKNNAQMNGGAISLNNEYETPSVVGSTSFYNNSAPYGGAVSSINAYLNTTSSVYQYNFAMISGGAISVSSLAYFESSFTNFTNNNCDGKGGAVRIEGDCNFVIGTNTLFQSNSANEGACLSLVQSQGKISHTQLIDCQSYRDGGAIYTSFSTFSISETIITNSSAEYGGAVYCSASKIDFQDNTQIYNNIDIVNYSGSEDSSDPGEIITNDYNIFCGIDPPYTYCNFTGIEPYYTFCGEPEIKVKQSLTKGQLAGIIVGSMLGAGILAFGVGILITKTTIKSYFVPLIRSTNNDGDEDDDDIDVHH